jgi:hypothetical protein
VRDEEPTQAANQRWYAPSTDHPTDVRSGDTAAANDISTADYDHNDAPSTTWMPSPVATRKDKG